MATQRTIPCTVFLFGACLLLIGLFAQASAQTNKGTIKGTVKDQSGAVIQNATVTVVNVATNEERTASTGDDGNRSEEHTSELQSRSDLVCRLLLEKKKKK